MVRRRRRRDRGFDRRARSRAASRPAGLRDLRHLVDRLIVWGFLERRGRGDRHPERGPVRDQPDRRLPLSDPQEGAEAAARMSVLTSRRSTRGRRASAAYAAHNRALAEELRAKVAEAAQGGPEKHRERHVSRGKLLPRDRVGAAARSRLALPRDRPARRLRHVQARGARRRHDRRHRPRLGARDDDRLQRRDGEGRHLLSDDGQEASARAGDRAAEPAAVRLPGRFAAAPICRTRPRSSPTATISAGSSTTRRRCRPRGSPRSPA